MYPEMDYYWITSWTAPFALSYTYPIPHECDMELVKKALQLIIDSINHQIRLIPEFKQLVCAVNNYIRECNNAFLASERIRNFLLLGLSANLIVTFIVLASIPITPLSIGLVCFSSLILFAVNLFTLYQQMQGLDQEATKNELTKCHKNFKEILKSNLTDKQEKIQCPTSTLCLFPAQKISQNDELKQNIDENSLNDSDFPPPKLNNHC